MVVVNGTELGNGWNKTSCTDGTYGTYCKYTQSCPIQVNGTSLSCIEVNGVNVFDNSTTHDLIQLEYDYRNLPGTCIMCRYSDEWEYYVVGECDDFYRFSPTCVCLACINDLNNFNIPKCTMAYWTDRRITPATFRAYNGEQVFGTDCLSFLGVSAACQQNIDAKLATYGVAVVFYGCSYSHSSDGDTIYCGTNICSTGCPYAFQVIYCPECFKDYYFSCYGCTSFRSRMYGESNICMNVWSNASYWSCNKLTNYQSCGNQTCRCIQERIYLDFSGVPDPSLSLTFGYQVNKNLQVTVCPKGNLKLHGTPTYELWPYLYQTVDPGIWAMCPDSDFGLGGWKTTCTIQNSGNRLQADISVTVPYCCQNPVSEKCWRGFYPIIQQSATTPSGRYSWNSCVCTDIIGFTARSEQGCVQTSMFGCSDITSQCSFVQSLINDCDIEIMPMQNWYASAVSSCGNINTCAFVSCAVGTYYNRYFDACASNQALACGTSYRTSGVRYGKK